MAKQNFTNIEQFPLRILRSLALIAFFSAATQGCGSDSEMAEFATPHKRGDEISPAGPISKLPHKELSGPLAHGPSILGDAKRRPKCLRQAMDCAGVCGGSATRVFVQIFFFGTRTFKLPKILP